MSKRITTRWTIGSWIVYVLAVIAFFVIGHNAQGSGSPPPGMFIPYAIMAVTGVVMLVMWIGALVKLGQQHAWGWFVGVLLLHPGRVRDHRNDCLCRVRPRGRLLLRGTPFDPPV